MLANPIDNKIRTQNAKRILANLGDLGQNLSMQRSAVFALQANGGADDRFALGPFTSPTQVEAVNFVSQLDAAITRTFTLHLSSDDSTAAIARNDINLLDPRSPTATFMPGRFSVTIPIGRLIPFRPAWIKLSRQKGGSVSFAMTCWVYLRQRP